MIQLLLEMSICLAAFYGLFILLYEAKNNHQFNRFYLLLSLLFSIGLPLLNLPVFPQYITPQFTAESSINTANIAQAAPFFFSFGKGLISLWILGLILNLFFFFKNVFSLIKIIKNSEKKEEVSYTKVFTDNKMAVSSFLNYLFIPKEQRHTISDYEIQHELSHIRQKHSLDILFVEVLKAIFWFHPIIYFYKKRLIEIHEFLADQNTSNELGKEAYEDFLICQVTTKQQTKLVHNFYSLFKKRLVMMQSNVSMKKWQYWAVLPLFLLCFTIFSCENYKVVDTKHTETYPLIPHTANDSTTTFEHDITDYPPIPPELVGENIDTIFTFDPETKTVSVHYEKFIEGKYSDTEKSHIYDKDGFTGIDTIIIFDPADYSETMIVVNHDTGEKDTIQ